MSDKRKRQREHPIPFRPHKELRATLIADAKRANMSMNGYLTMLCDGKPSPRQVRRSALEEKQLCKVLVELAGIKKTLIEHTDDNSKDSILIVKKCHEELILMRNFIFSVSGRKP
jgi:hypothetical protein